MTDEVDLSFFLFCCGDYCLSLLKRLSPVDAVSPHRNEWCGTWRDTLKLLDGFCYCRSQQPDVWVDQKGDVAMLLHRLYYPSEAALNDSTFIFKPNNVSQSLLNRSSSFPCSVSQRWIMGIILFLLNLMESLRYIQTHRTVLVWELSNIASPASSSITFCFPSRKYFCSFHEKLLKVPANHREPDRSHS